MENNLNKIDLNNDISDINADDSFNSEEEEYLSENVIIKKKKKIKLDKKNNIINEKIKINYKKIDDNKILDQFPLDKKFDFNKNNIIYSWKDEEFLTTFNRKSESGNLVYLVCSKRGYDGKACKGKAKFDRNKGIVYIYDKCDNNKNNHNIIDYEYFREMYNQDNYKNIDFNLYIYQKLYIKCLFEDNLINNYSEAINKFNGKFKNIKFKLSEYIVQNIKRETIGGLNNLNIEELCKTLALNNENIHISIYPIQSEYKNANSSDITIREQNIIIIGHKEMLKYLDSKYAKMYGIDCTYKIIPKSYNPYKLMTIYSIESKLKKSIIAAFICLKYNDYNSLIKIFSLLNALYSFSPISVNCDFDKAQIKAIKNCNLFNKKPYVIPCLFHYAQSIMRKLKAVKLFKKKVNKRSLEWLYNLEILCFLNSDKIENQFNLLKEKTIGENEKEFIKYYENIWIKKNKNIFNYSEIISNLNKCKNNYIKKKRKN